MKPRHFFEPWRAARSSSWETPFRFGPPPVDDAEVVDRWHAARDRAQDYAEWLVWGSHMVQPQACLQPDGTVVVADDQHILASVPHHVSDGGRGPDQAQVAQRIVACVNALEGVSDPVQTIGEARAFLLALLKGDAKADDPRLFKLVARLTGPIFRTDQLCPSDT